MIPVFKPILSGNEKKYLNICVKEKWFSSNGKYNLLLEDKFKKIVQRKYASTVCNWTVAIELAIKSLNIKPGSEVIVPTFTIISPILAIIRNKLKPVFVDIDLKYWNINSREIEKKITSKTKLILLVHTYGFPSNMNEIMNLKKKYKLFLIEDAAEMHGQFFLEKPCGSFGDLSTFSFYSNKFISSGEGGIVCTNNSKLKKKIDSLRNLSFGKQKRFRHDELGYNFRMSNLQAAVAYSQIDNIKKIVKIKRDIGRKYNRLFENNSNIITLPFRNSYSTNIYWVYGIILRKHSKKKIVNYLKKKNIDTRDFFVGMHNQPILKKMKIVNKSEKFPNSDFLEKNGFYIPSGPDINNNDIKFIAKTINEYLEN